MPSLEARLAPIAFVCECADETGVERELSGSE